MKDYLTFTDRLYFVEIDARMFAVMAYSQEDARRQVDSALIREHWDLVLDMAMREYEMWYYRTAKDFGIAAGSAVTA